MDYKITVVVYMYYHMHQIHKNQAALTLCFVVVNYSFQTVNKIIVKNINLYFTSVNHYCIVILAGVNLFFRSVN